jgi:hypothetical protein
MRKLSLGEFLANKPEIQKELIRKRGSSSARQEVGLEAIQAGG